MSIKQHDVEQTISHRRNQKAKFTNSIILKQNQKHGVPKLVGCRKMNCLEQQMPTIRKMKTSNKQPTLTPRGTRKKRKKQGSRNKGHKRTPVQRQIIVVFKEKNR